MTALRESAIKELEKLPEDKISFILQIMQGVNGLYNDGQSERKKHLQDWSSYAGKGLLRIMTLN